MAKTPLKYLSIAGILILLCIIGYYLIKAGYKGINPVLSELIPEAVTVKNFQYTQDDPDEGAGFVLDADEGTWSQDRQRVSLKRFRLKLEPVDSPAMEIKGNKADWDTISNVINLSGDLRGEGGRYRIFTEYLSYEQKNGVLKTDEPVRITGPFFSMSGKGLIFYTEKETFEIVSDITGLIELTEKGLRTK
ncbi:MAG: LPS export ABC transporter periplasmic protein LptC [Deltaproteobacteria bacterium]|nr:LPS export ABC transporter periplasmic protein LptC [Deltaproteobacteria bacterium]